jgi:NAD(P) transhydrogenase
MPLGDPDVYDPVEILHRERLPNDLLVVGGGSVGCEYASLFTALGVEVTLVDPHPSLLRSLDTEISHLQAEVFTGMGMRLFLGSPLTDVRRVAGQLAVRLADGQVLSPEKILFATGRAGSTEGLGLEEAGVAVNAKGDIVVNDRFETTAPGIFAAGDVIGPLGWPRSRWNRPASPSATPLGSSLRTGSMPWPPTVPSLSPRRQWSG